MRSYPWRISSSWGIKKSPIWFDLLSLSLQRLQLIPYNSVDFGCESELWQEWEWRIMRGWESDKNRWWERSYSPAAPLNPSTAPEPCSVRSNRTMLVVVVAERGRAKGLFKVWRPHLLLSTQGAVQGRHVAAATGGERGSGAGASERRRGEAESSQKPGGSLSALSATLIGSC